MTWAQSPPGPCSDGLDNDGDTKVDAADPGCTSPQDLHEEENICAHPSPHSHGYGTGGSAGARSDAATGGDEVSAGVVTVSETNAFDCDGDGVPGDYDGDWETGVGGAFFGYGTWHDEPVCNYGLAEHGNTVAVSDFVHGNDVWFVIGADDTDGPTVSTDPVTSETTCSTDGSITPCDPVTGCGTTGDPYDCLTEPMNIAKGVGGPYQTCGAGGDGGYWVFLNGAFVQEVAGNPSAANPPTAGTITA